MWHTSRPPGLPTPAGDEGPLSYPLAVWLLAIYTRRRDLILTLDDDPILAAATCTTGRRYQALADLTPPYALDEGEQPATAILLAWPRPEPTIPHSQTIRDAADLLQPGGCLITLLPTPATDTALESLHAAARDAGLRPLQRIRAVQDSPHDMPNRFVYPPADTATDTTHHPDPDSACGHLDLLIFTRGGSDD